MLSARSFALVTISLFLVASPVATADPGSEAAEGGGLGLPLAGTTEDCCPGNGWAVEAVEDCCPGNGWVIERILETV